MECGDTLLQHINMDMVMSPCSHIHTLDIKIDLFKIGTMLIIIFQGFYMYTASVA